MTQPTADDADGTQQPQPYSTLPHNNKTYSQHAYWEERFEHESEYEWLVGFNDIRTTLLPLLRPSDRILVLGCGNSNLSTQLYSAGYTHITNIDYSDTVIRKQAAKHSDQPLMRWHTMDMLQMTFPPHSFDVALDKCTMDALTTTEGSPWQPNPATRQAVHSMLSAVSSVLAADGRYVQVSFTQPHFRHKYLKRRQYGWAVRTQRLGDGVAAVFVYECAKGGREDEWEDDVWSDDEEKEEGGDGRAGGSGERCELSSDEEDVLNAIELSDAEEEEEAGRPGEGGKRAADASVNQSTDARSADR